MWKEAHRGIVDMTKCTVNARSVCKGHLNCDIYLVQSHPGTFSAPTREDTSKKLNAYMCACTDTSKALDPY